MLTHLDLFSGIGGLALAAQWAGFRTVGFCEREPYAQQILKERFGAVLADAEGCNNGGANTRGTDRSEEKRKPLQSGGCNRPPRPLLHSNIFTLDGSDYAGVDLLTGGFPCQPFSVAGKRLGKEDDRAIWPQMLRVIDEARPGWVLAENVPGIINMELDRVLSDLETIGYSTGTLVVPACAVDAKHRRDRVWIVAHATQRQDDGRNGGGVDAAEGRREGQHAAAHARGEDVADASSERRQGQGPCGERGRAAENSEGQAGDAQSVGQHCEWLPEPELGRVAHGIPHRAHRLRGLGNAIVPQVAFEILSAIRGIKP